MSKLNPALIDGNHPSEHPDVMAASKKADAIAARTEEAHAVWIRPNYPTCFVVPDDTDNRLEGCVMKGSILVIVRPVTFSILACPTCGHVNCG